MMKCKKNIEYYFFILRKERYSKWTDVEPWDAEFIRKIFTITNHWTEMVFLYNVIYHRSWKGFYYFFCPPPPPIIFFFFKLPCYNLSKSKGIRQITMYVYCIYILWLAIHPLHCFGRIPILTKIRLKKVD